MKRPNGDPDPREWEEYADKLEGELLKLRGALDRIVIEVLGIDVNWDGDPLESDLVMMIDGFKDGIDSLLESR